MWTDVRRCADRTSTAFVGACSCGRRGSPVAATEVGHHLARRAWPVPIVTPVERTGSVCEPQHGVARLDVARHGPAPDGEPRRAPIRVLLADDHEVVRTGFRLMLGVEHDIEVVGEAATGRGAVEAARRLRPDVVLMDVRMPELDGLAATRVLVEQPDPPRVVVVTTFDLDEYVYGAVRAGACGFLLKDAGPTLLVEAVRAAVNGDALVSPSVTVRLLQHLPVEPGEPSAAYPLTPRELEIVRAVARGRTNVEIAAELAVSLSTVKTHLTNVQTKLAARNRVEIAAWAWRGGHVH